MELDIYGSDGVLKVTVGVDDSSTQVKELMGDNVLSLGFVLYEHVALDVNDYVDFLGERYWLMERYVPAMRNSQEWVYSIRMFGLESLIKRFLVLDSVDGDADPVFTLTAPPSDHVALIVDCINEGMGCDDWTVGTVDGEDNVVIDYEGKYCDEALRELADVLGTEFWFDGTTVNVCRCERGTAVSLSHGEGLVGLEREEASNVKLYTRLFPVGSSRNIDPERYGHSRLMLPDGRKYVDVNVERYGVIHHYEKDAFAGIYPRRVGRVSSVRWETAMNDDGSEYRIYFFKDSGLNFNPNDYELEGEVKRVSFQEGSDLAGLGEGDDHYFEVNWNNSTHEFEIITIWPYGDGTALPGGSLIPAVGDSYILWNIGMPDSYYEDAEEELLAAVEEYNAKHGVDSSVYKGRTDHTWMEAHEDVCLQLGQRVRLGHESFFEDGYRVSRITKTTRKVNLPGEVDLEVSDVVGTGTMQKLNDDIKGVRIYAKEVAEGAARVNIIGTGSSEGASDSSVFSSLRSVREFLSKTGNDAAHGVISFLKGLVARDDGDNPSVDAETIEADNINVSGDVCVDGNSHVGSSTVDGNQTVGGNQTVTGNQTVAGTSNVANENVDGNLNVGGTIETANLQVNGTAHFWEVVIDKISSVGGSAMFTPADGFKLDHFSDVGTTGKKLYWQGGNGSVNMWAVGDMALCYKNVSGNEIYWWAKVTAVGSETASGKTYHYIVVSTSDKDGTIELVEGADVVQCGHKKQTNETSAQAKARQGAVYIASSNSLDRGLVAPLIAKYEGINDYDLSLFRAGYQAQNGSKFVGDFEISSGGSTIPLDEYIGSHQPYIGTDKYWYVWDLATNQYKKSVLAEGAPGTPGGDGVTPHIGDNGNWWIGNLDTGVSAKGDPGTPGDDGTSVTIVSQSVTYGVNNSGTVKPTTWQANVPTTSAGQYLWTRTIVTYSDGTTTTSYSVSYHGVNGNNGTTYYTWIKYADTASGGGLSDDPTGKEYIGFAYNKTTATESIDPSDYSWSLIRGEQGVPGEPGTDGTTYHTWIKYSDVLSPTLSSQIYDTPKSTTIAIGIAVNKTDAGKSPYPSDYTWSRFKGEQGVPGSDAVEFVVNPPHLEFDFSVDVARTIVKSATIECYKGGVKQDVRVIKVTDGQVNCTSSVAYDTTNYVNTVSLTVASSKVSVQSITGEDRYLAPTSGYAEVRANVGGVTYYIVIDFTVNQKTTYQQFLVDENQFKSTYESFKEDVNGTLTQQGTQISQNSAGITTLAQTQTQQGNTISQHTSQISQQSDRIDSVVSTQTQQGNTISQHSSRISQNAEQISLAVERQEEYGRQNLAFDPLYRGDIWVKDASTSEHVALEGTAITSYGLAPSMTNQVNDYPPFPELDNLCYRIYAPSIPSTIPSSGATLYGRYADRNNRMELPSGKVVTVSVWVYNDREEALDSTQVVSALMVYTSKTGTSAYGSPIYNSMMPADSNWHNSAYLGGRYKNLGVVSTVTNGDRIWSQVAIVIDINSSSITRYIEHVPYVLIHRPSSPYRLNMYYSEWRVEEGDTPSHEVFSNNVEKNLISTGIDITHREIVVTSDNFKIQNNEGVRTFYVNRYGDIVYSGTAIRSIKTLDFGSESSKNRYLIQGVESNNPDIGRSASTLWGFDALQNDGVFNIVNAPNGTAIYLPCCFEVGLVTHYTRVQTVNGTGVAHMMSMQELKSLIGRRLVFFNDTLNKITVNIGAKMGISSKLTTSSKIIYITDDNGYTAVFPTSSFPSGDKTYYNGGIEVDPGYTLILDFTIGTVQPDQSGNATLGYYWRYTLISSSCSWEQN